RATVLANQREIGVGPPPDPGMRVEEERVTENRAGAENSDLICPLDRRLAVAPDHLLYFENTLRNVDREWDAALVRGIPAVAQQLRRAILDLHRRHDAG